MHQWISIDVDQRQVFIRGCRLHHGIVGAVAILTGIALAVHDRHDLHRWLPDLKGKP